MTHGCVPLRQIAALLAAVALFNSPIAAQTSVPSAPGEASLPTIVLNAAAFARLAKMTQPDTGPVPPRLESLPHSPMATVRRADASVANRPVRSRSAGHKVVVVLAVVGVIAGALAISLYTGADFDPMLEGLLQWVAK